jgi:hypothetical protein
MKLRIVGRITKGKDGRYVGHTEDSDFLSATGVLLDGFDATAPQPQPLKGMDALGQVFDGDETTWGFHNRIVRVNGAKGVPDDEMRLRVKHSVLGDEKKLEKIAREIEAFENLASLPKARRERISDAVLRFVWQRDEGKCVKCGSQRKLEYDHIIPIADGGSNTKRNVQLLCETCNRQKGKNVT